jgi:hypothetical protein
MPSATDGVKQLKYWKKQQQLKVKKDTLRKLVDISNISSEKILTK